MITQDKHRLKYQAKTGTAIPNSPLTTADKFNLPINTIIHYMTDTLSEFGMKGNNTVLHNWENEIFLKHVTEGYGEEGKPKITNVSGSVEQSFFKNQVRLRRTRRIEKTLLKPRNLMVLDYSLLPHKLRYTQGLKQFYFEFINIAQAYVNSIETVGKNHENYIMVNMPDKIPAKSSFGKIKMEPGIDELNRFNEPALLWLRELWLVADGEGILAKVSRPEHINFLLFDDGKFVSLNLGLYLSHAETKGSTAQKALMGLLENLLDSRSAVEDGDLPQVEEGETLSFEGASDELRDGLNEAVQEGTMTTKERDRFIKVTEATLETKSPIGDGSIKDAMKEIPGETDIDSKLMSPANPLTADVSDKKSITTNLTRDYVNKSLERDILKSIMSLNKVGIIVKDVKREQVLDAANDNSVYIISYVMPNGKSGTRRLRIPNVKPNGLYRANNVDYTNDHSKIDVPIRKVSESRVALTSYYGKVFISRSDRATDNYSAWLSRKVSKFSLDVRDQRVVNGRMGNNPLPKEQLPRDYTALMTKISQFQTGSFVFNFEYLRINDLYPEEEIKVAKKLKMVPCGKSGKNTLLMDKNSIVHVLGKDGTKELSDIRDMVGGEWGKVPVDKAIVSVFGKKTPVGLILGRWLGLEALIKRTKIKYRKVPSNVRSSAEDSEFVVKFKDFHYYFDKGNVEATMIMASFMSVSKQLELYNAHEFEKPAVYTTILLNHGLHTLAIREIKLIRDGFVDHITEEILKDMGEPTKVIDLLFRAVELLRDDVSPDETDPSLMRIRGYERISGFLYKTFIDAARVQRGAPNPKNAALDIRVNSVWQMLVGDATTQLAQSINPVHSLKEQEGVSLSGEGGRSATSLVQKTRVFHKDDVGIFSESVPDSAKVAIRTFLPPNAAIKNTRGMLGKYDKENGTAGALSTTSNLLPAANHDDKQSVVDKSL